MTNIVKIFNAAMDDTVEAGSPLGIVLRGSLDLATLDQLKVDDYQREVQKYSSQKKIRSALDNGQLLPDIELGMRGQNFSERDEVYALKDPVYIVDGLQRVSTTVEWMRQNPDRKPRLGAVVHFNTDQQWERQRFQKLNNNRSRVSPNVLLRNMRNDNRAVLTLYGLSFNEQTFPLHGRVCWQQNMKRGDLMTALLLLKISTKLHAHVVTRQLGRQSRDGRSFSGQNPEELATTMMRRMDVITMQTFRKNIHTFFSILDELWGIRDIQYKDESCHMHGTFLGVLAKLFSGHLDFWRGETLAVDLKARAKIKKFSLNDPEVRRLCGASGAAIDILYFKMMEHFNSGKRTNRLHPRNGGRATQAAAG